MSFLLLYIGRGKTFDSEQLRIGFKVSPNVHEFTTGCHGTLYQWEYHFNDDFTMVRLKDDLETIVIEGMGPASLQAALEIQRLCSAPVRLIDDGYSFDIELSKVTSVDDLHRNIEQAES